MFRWQESHLPALDPAVVPIERLPDWAAARHPVGAWRGRLRHLVTICACVTSDSSPSWIIHDTAEGIGWRRSPDELLDPEAAGAPFEARGHAPPAKVLPWLEGSVENPWEAGGNGFGDLRVVRELQRWITGL